jgi:hypothetical protein
MIWLNNYSNGGCSWRWWFSIGLKVGNPGPGYVIVIPVDNDALGTLTLNLPCSPP